MAFPVPSAAPATVAVETVSVEQAINSRTSYGPGHFGQYDPRPGELLPPEALQALAWAAYQAPDLAPALPLRLYAVTPEGQHRYDPQMAAWVPDARRLTGHYVPEGTGRKGYLKLNLLPAIEGVDLGHQAEPIHFDALWKLGYALQAMALLAAGLAPRPLAVGLIGNERIATQYTLAYEPPEVAPVSLFAGFAAPAWPGDRYHAADLPPDWQTDPAWGDPQGDGALPLAQALMQARTPGTPGSRALPRQAQNQLLWGAAGSTNHWLDAGPTPSPKPRWAGEAAVRLRGAAQPSAQGHYFIRAGDPRSLAYVVDEEGLWRYTNLDDANRPTSTFRLVYPDRTYKARLEEAVHWAGPSCPLYVIIHAHSADWQRPGYNVPWMPFSSFNMGCYTLLEGAALDCNLRLQAASLGLAVHTQLLNVFTLRDALSRLQFEERLISPLAVVGVGYPE